MHHEPLNSIESLEDDPVWKLLDQAPPPLAGPHFVNDTLRAARLATQAQTWWQRLLAPAPLAGLAAASAAVLFSLFCLIDRPLTPPTQANISDSTQAAAIQDIAESETLITAVDHLDNFSDTELVSLIGF